MEAATSVQEARPTIYTKPGSKWRKGDSGYLLDWADAMYTELVPNPKPPGRGVKPMIRMINATERAVLRVMIYRRNRLTGRVLLPQAQICALLVKHYNIDISERQLRTVIKSLADKLPKYFTRGAQQVQSTQYGVKSTVIYTLELERINESLGLHPFHGMQVNRDSSFAATVAEQSSGKQDEYIINKNHSIHSREPESRMTENDVEQQGANVASAEPPVEHKPEPQDQGQRPTGVQSTGGRVPYEDLDLCEVEDFSSKLTEDQSNLWDKMKIQGWGVYPGVFVKMLKAHGLDKALEAYARVHDSAGVQNPGAYWKAIMDGRIRLDSGKSEARDEALAENEPSDCGQVEKAPPERSESVPGVEETKAMLCGDQRVAPDPNGHLSPICRQSLEKYGWALGFGGINYLQHNPGATPEEAYRIFQSD